MCTLNGEQENIVQEANDIEENGNETKVIKEEEEEAREGLDGLKVRDSQVFHKAAQT